jgi:hypothetical protein
MVSCLHELFPGVLALPLTVLGRVRGFLGRGRGRCALRRGVATGSGLAWPREALRHPNISPAWPTLRDRSTPGRSTTKHFTGDWNYTVRPGSHETPYPPGR